MHVLVRASVVVAVATALGSLDRGPVDPAPVVVPPAKARGIDGMPAPCGRGTLPEGDVCVALPKAAEGSVAASAGAREAKLPPRLRSGLEVAQEIPKLPDRPADWSRYVLPVGEGGAAPRVSSAAGRAGVDVAAERGAPVRAVALEHQEGDAEVLFVGDLLGPTVVTAHAVREADRVHTFVLVYGHLDHAAPGLAAHAHLAAGAPIGATGGAALHLEARELRERVNASSLDAKKLLDPGTTLATDPRNVLVVR